jgi:transposase InsO family protein
VRTWTGFAYVSIVFDAYSHFIAGWQAASHLRTDLAREVGGRAGRRPFQQPPETGPMQDASRSQTANPGVLH